MLVYILPHKPTSQIYFGNLFRDQGLNWKKNYLFPWKAWLGCYVRSFQYKVLNDVFCLNNDIFGKSSSPVCSFSKNTKCFFEKYANLPCLSSQTAFLVFTNTYCNDMSFKHHISLLFKICVYNSRELEKIPLNNLISNVTKVKNIKNEIAGNNEKKIMLYKKKWKKIENTLNEKS